VEVLLCVERVCETWKRELEVRERELIKKEAQLDDELEWNWSWSWRLCLDGTSSQQLVRLSPNFKVNCDVVRAQ
jgi:hypothetical protein